MSFQGACDSMTVITSPSVLELGLREDLTLTVGAGFHATGGPALYRWTNPLKQLIEVPKKSPS